MGRLGRSAGAARKDQDILAALTGIIEMQRTIRRQALDCSVWTGLFFLRAYYLRLPASVARRLTEIDPKAVAVVLQVTDAHVTGDELRKFCDRVADDAAFAQAIRAANVYMDRLKLGRLGPDGKPIQEDEAGLTQLELGEVLRASAAAVDAKQEEGCHEG